MRTSDVDIVIVPGWGDSGPDHWQSRWQRNLKTARRAVQSDWHAPRLVDWIAGVERAVMTSTRPAVIVAHSLGVATLVHAAPRLAASGHVAGAFLVGPADLDSRASWPTPGSRGSSSAA